MADCKVSFRDEQSGQLLEITGPGGDRCNHYVIVQVPVELYRKRETGLAEFGLILLEV